MRLRWSTQVVGDMKLIPHRVSMKTSRALLRKTSPPAGSCTERTHTSRHPPSLQQNWPSPVYWYTVRDIQRIPRKHWMCLWGEILCEQKCFSDSSKWDLFLFKVIKHSSLQAFWFCASEEKEKPFCWMTNGISDKIWVFFNRFILETS